MVIETKILLKPENRKRGGVARFRNGERAAEASVSAGSDRVRRRGEGVGEERARQRKERHEEGGSMK